MKRKNSTNGGTKISTKCKVISPCFRTKVEEEYWFILEEKRQSGLIQWFEYECAAFIIGKNCRYTPDFMVVDHTGQVEAHEVKGPYIKGGWQHAIVRFKAAAKMFPWIRFVMWQKTKHGWSRIR
jgi:hypothetical protein